MNKKNGLTKVIWFLLIIVIILLAIVLINNISNSSSDEKNVIENVELNPKKETIYEGDTLQIEVIVTPNEMSDKVVWESTNSLIATVDNGLVTGIKEGTIAIKAKVGDYEEYSIIEVKRKVIPVEKIELVSEKTELIVGDASIVNATIIPVDATNQSIIWSSSDSNILEVDNGNILAKNSGTATITAQIDDVSSNVTIIVKPKIIDVTSLSFNVSKMSINTGESFTIVGTISPDNATDKVITWSSSDNSIATVSNGVVKCLKAGTVTITGKSNNGKMATCIVTIKNKILPAKVPTESPTKSYKSDTLSYYVINKSGHYLTYIWMKEPYNQIKKLDANTANYGKIMTDTDLSGQKLYRSSVNDMLRKYISNGMIPNNKAAIAFNASGFYVQGSWNPPTDYYNNRSDAWYNVNEGVVIRNNVNDLVTNRQIIGFDYNGDLKIYGSSNQLAKRQEIVKAITDDKVKNTFSFTPILVLNGVSQKLTDPTKAQREAICQLDSNNYIMFTSKAYGNFTTSEVRDMFMNFGCKTAFNLDGGGSTQMAIKDTNGKVNNFLCTDGKDRKTCRNIVEGIYFVEQ